jgi:peroxiredoxin
MIENGPDWARRWGGFARKCLLQLKTAFGVAKQGGSNMADNNQANLLQVDWSVIPAPEDDGGANHLQGMQLPSLELSTTDDTQVNLAELEGTSIVFIYPMTGRPDVALPDNWDMIPGARGCTPQACSFRDLHSDLKTAGADHVFGLSAQTSDYQKEARDRLHLPFPLISDAGDHLRLALDLPSMEVEGMKLLKRLTLICIDGVIAKAFYPVFPPDRSAEDVLDWLRT